MSLDRWVTCLKKVMRHVNSMKDHKDTKVQTHTLIKYSHRDIERQTERKIEREKEKT